jgi:hypothetical protein
VIVISGHQPAFNPWVGYMHKIIVSDKFVFMDDVQFEKNSFINRNQLLNKNGPFWLTLSVSTKGHLNKTIDDMVIMDNNWRKKHLNSLQMTYGKSPYFKEVFSLLEDIYNFKSDSLSDFIFNSLIKNLEYLDMNTSKIQRGRELNIASKKENYVLDAVKKLNGHIFFFGKNGREYVDASYFLSKNVYPLFQSYVVNEYDQFNSDSFESHLGIWDIMFNHNKKDVVSCIMKNNLTKKDILSSF